jgi:hypothetical protein
MTTDNVKAISLNLPGKLYQEVDTLAHADGKGLYDTLRLCIQLGAEVLRTEIERAKTRRMFAATWDEAVHGIGAVSK